MVVENTVSHSINWLQAFTDWADRCSPSQTIFMAFNQIMQTVNILSVYQQYNIGLLAQDHYCVLSTTPVVLSEFYHTDLCSYLFHCWMPKLSTVIIIQRLNSFFLSFISHVKNNMSCLKKTSVRWRKKNMTGLATIVKDLHIMRGRSKRRYLHVVKKRTVWFEWESDFNVSFKGNPDKSHPDTIQIRDAW